MDMPEALRQIKDELGPDAVILSTRQVKPGKGVFGMLGRPLLEVTAAAEIDLPASADRRHIDGRTPVSLPAKPEADHGALLALQADVESLREQLCHLGRRSHRHEPEPIVRRVKVLTEKVDRLLDQTNRMERMRLSPGLRRIHAHLDAIDLEASLAGRILNFLQEKIDSGVVTDGTELEAFGELIRRTVLVGGSLLPEGSRPKVVALVGPTGVGKTTTVAKLAARFALQEGRNVGLITVDTFRIAAVEQLKTYAKIIGVPIRVVLDAAGFRAAVEELSDRDLVLVDTAGQSPTDQESLMALLGFFPEDVGVEVHMVLAVTTRARDLEKILCRYAPVRPSRLLLTKLDETECHGPLLGLPLASRLPLSYLTTGQNVPDDIEEASPPLVADHIVRGLRSAA